MASIREIHRQLHRQLIQHMLDEHGDPLIGLSADGAFIVRGRQQISRLHLEREGEQIVLVRQAQPQSPSRTARFFGAVPSRVCPKHSTPHVVGRLEANDPELRTTLRLIVAGLPRSCEAC